MDALDEKNGTVVEAYAVAAVFASAGGEVVVGEFCLFAAEQPLQVVVECRYVESMEALVVIFARGVARRALAVDEVVVKRNHARFEQVGRKVYR